MKNAIKYYYNIEVGDIHQKDNVFSFESGHEKYILYVYEDSLERIKEIYNLHIYLLQNGLYCHQIILNFNNEPFIIVDNKCYVLLRINIIDRKIEYQDVVEFSKQYLIKKTTENNWADLWEKKTDYIEYQVSQFSIKYPLISQSSNYYIGLAETAIEYFRNQKLKSKSYSISHKRLKHNSTLIDLYNPLNFIVDLSIRNICEYMKTIFFEKKIDIVDSVLKLNLNLEDVSAFLSRMLYPTYYFDAIEECIDYGKEENIIIKYINKVDEYEEILSSLFICYKKIYNLELIDWIIKT